MTEKTLKDTTTIAYNACIDELKYTLTWDEKLFNHLVVEMDIEVGFLWSQGINKWMPMDELKYEFRNMDLQEEVNAILDGNDKYMDSGLPFNPLRNYYRFEGGILVSSDYDTYVDDVTMDEVVDKLLADCPYVAKGTKVENLVNCICALFKL